MNRPIRRGGPNGVTCLGNNEPDGKSYLANWGGMSIGCHTKQEAEQMVAHLRELERGEHSRCRSEQ